MAKKVLIVDDDKEILSVLKKDLGKYSRAFSVLTAEDGQAAVEMLKRNKISLVVTDLKMPKMDGLTLLTHLKNHYPDIFAIIITGYSTPENKKQAQKQGAVGFIEKPFATDDLAKRIFATLKRESDGGVLHGMAPGTFLQLVEMEQKTCTIRLTHDKTGNQGALFFNEGELLDARINEIHGRDAAYKILAWEEATLAIQESCTLSENKIQADLQAILLEAMRLKDEEEREPEDRMSQEEIDAYIAAEQEKEPEPEIMLEMEGPEIVEEVEGPDLIVEEDETKIELEKEAPATVVPDKPKMEETKEEPGFTDISKPPSMKKSDISYSVTDNIFGIFSNLKESVFGSAVVRYTFRAFFTIVLVGLIGFTYLYITMESDKDLISKIDQAKVQIRSAQETLYKLDEEIQRLYSVKENSITNNESQVVIMDLELKISELEEKQEKILTETKIQQETLRKLQEKLEEIKRKSFFDRLFKGVDDYLPLKR